MTGKEIADKQIKDLQQRIWKVQKFEFINKTGHPLDLSHGDEIMGLVDEVHEWLERLHWESDAHELLSELEDEILNPLMSDLLKQEDESMNFSQVRIRTEQRDWREAEAEWKRMFKGLYK